MNGKAPLGLRDDEAGVHRRNLAERGVSLLLEVLEVAVVGAKLAAQLLPGNELRGEVLLHDNESAVRDQSVKVEGQGRTFQGPERPHIDGNGRSNHCAKKLLP